jgi:hypothetical protein
MTEDELLSAIETTMSALEARVDRLGLQHLDARLERADRIGQIAGRDVAPLKGARRLA